MSDTKLPLTTIEKVAARLERDIRQKQLRPGDRYLTAAEASELFDVNSMTMHRAMRALAGREMLVRMRNRGTFVGPKFGGDDEGQPTFDVLHVVMAIDYHRTQNFSSDTLVDEFSQAMPGTTIQVHHLLESGALRYIDRLIDRHRESDREGFVLIRCPREVQLRVSESGIPAVVFGHVYPDISLAGISHDQESVGRLMAEYVLQQGARRFALLTHARWRFGDHKMIDAATATLGAAGVQLDAVKIRSMAPEREIVREGVRETLACDDPPDAFLCRSDFYAREVGEMIRSGEPGCHAGICVVSGSHGPPAEATSFARVVSKLTLPEQVEHITKLLCQLAGATPAAWQAISSQTVVVPVEFQYGVPAQGNGSHRRPVRGAPSSGR
jgi:DNA-binding LacI/PurR family transcriptional regulator/DNA-binding transcriptional regulator YhcF (GntR family)